MNIANTLGYLMGYPLGIITGSISFIRASRMFHPQGIVVQAKVKNLWKEKIEFPEDAIIRFSSAWWKHKEWRDALGIAIRFGNIQDLLLVSFKHAWQTPISPMLTKYKDFFSNDYYAVAPFKVGRELVYFKMTPQEHGPATENRTTSLFKNIHHHAGWRLFIRIKDREWIPLADITLQDVIDVDQERLKFDPFLNGLGINPEGFIHYLRVGTYRLGQLGRALRNSGRKSVNEMSDHVDDRLVIHRL